MSVGTDIQGEYTYDQLGIRITINQCWVITTYIWAITTKHWLIEMQLSCDRIHPNFGAHTHIFFSVYKDRSKRNIEMT